MSGTRSSRRRPPAPRRKTFPPQPPTFEAIAAPPSVIPTEAGANATAQWRHLLFLDAVHASPPAPHPHELTTKRRGELAELAFTLKAASLGFGVAKPYGDSERYDFIVDARSTDPSLNVCHPKRSHPVCEANRIAPSKDLVTLAPERNSHHELTTPHTLHRIQVKCSTQLLNGLYRINAHRRTGGRAVPYLPNEIDFLVAYIIPEDTWYVLPLAAIHSRTSLLFRRRDDPKPGLYDQYREAWHLLRPK